MDRVKRIPFGITNTKNSITEHLLMNGIVLKVKFDIKSDSFVQNLQIKHKILDIFSIL